MMIPHHEQAVTMSELVLTNTANPEVKTLAENIVKSQSAEIEAMKALLG